VNDWSLALPTNINGNAQHSTGTHKIVTFHAQQSYRTYKIATNPLSATKNFTLLTFLHALGEHSVTCLMNFLSPTAPH